jgi:ABC-type sugar transport system ATPase subunit
MTAMMVQIRGVQKSFGHVTVLKRVGLDVPGRVGDLPDRPLRVGQGLLRLP